MLRDFSKEYLRRIAIAHPYADIKDVPISSIDRIRLHCRICNSDWVSCPANLAAKNGERRFGCPVCGYRKVAQDLTTPSKELILRLKKAHPRIIAVEIPVSSSHKTDLCCTICGHQWKQAIAHLTTAHGISKIGCPNCKKSKGEEAIASFLIRAGLVYEQQKKFENCHNKRPLPFDFFVPSLGILIEYQGEQHFHPMRYKKARMKFRQVRRHDAIKRRWACNSGFEFMEIKYTDNIEKLLKSRFSQKSRLAEQL